MNNKNKETTDGDVRIFECTIFFEDTPINSLKTVDEIKNAISTLNKLFNIKLSHSNPRVQDIEQLLNISVIIEKDKLLKLDTKRKNRSFIFKDGDTKNQLYYIDYKDIHYIEILKADEF